MDSERILIAGVAHWLYEDGTTLPVMAGGDGPHPPPLSPQHHQQLHRGLETVGGDVGGGLTVIPVPGLPGAVQILIGGEPAKDKDGNLLIVGAEDFLTATQQFAPPAPPAFSGTPAGLQLQAELDRQTQAENNAALFERQGLIEKAAAERQKASDAAAKIRQLISTVGSGVQAQLGEAGAFRRGLLGEVGSGARSELEQATARRGQSITAILDTFRNLGDLSARPSDFVRLAFNAQGIQPPGATPTDTLIGQQQQFFQNQLGTANAAAQGFGDVFSTNREAIGGFGEPANFADLFSQARGQVGGFQFGGRPQEEAGVIEMRRSRGGAFERAAIERAAIVGENRQPELVFGATEVIPNLSPSEVRLLRQGGVGGAQFGEVASPEVLAGVSGGPGRRLTAPQRDAEPNVFDFPTLQAGAGTSPLFGGGFTRAGAGGVGAVTRAPALNPLDFSAQRFSSLLPFEQQLALGRFGETIVNPETGAIQRAGIDPQTVLEMIRRSSLFGRAPAVPRFG